MGSVWIRLILYCAWIHEPCVPWIGKNFLGTRKKELAKIWTSFEDSRVDHSISRSLSICQDSHRQSAISSSGAHLADTYISKRTQAWMRFHQLLESWAFRLRQVALNLGSSSRITKGKSQNQATWNVASFSHRSLAEHAGTTCATRPCAHDEWEHYQPHLICGKWLSKVAFRPFLECMMLTYGSLTLATRTY